MLSLYIHIPFCVRKCRYCGFYSTRYSTDSADGFIGGLKQEASIYRNELSCKRFSSIYIGGGTPTILSQEQFSSLFKIINEHFSIDNAGEFTVEANPNTLTKENLGLMLARGVNRLSLGVQSFSDRVLQSLGRAHNAEQARKAFIAAKSIGFENIGVDLIYGIPGQTVLEWEETLNAVISMHPEHVSVYSLSLDEGSTFLRDFEAGRFTLPGEEIVAQMYERAALKLRFAGYGRYEISNFSLPGRECRHNVNYWERGEYLGLGPGAWSFLSGQRYANIANIPEYVRRLSGGMKPVDVHECVDASSAAREIVLLGLRTMKGIDLAWFDQEYGHTLLQQLEKNAAPLEQAGLLLVTGGRMKLTDRGILVSDEVFARLAV
jgi:oxygen-independent coproporphyrinogen-3 oxidase